MLPSPATCRLVEPTSNFVPMASLGLDFLVRGERRSPAWFSHAQTYFSRIATIRPSELNSPPVAVRAFRTGSAGVT